MKLDTRQRRNWRPFCESLSKFVYHKGLLLSTGAMHAPAQLKKIVAVQNARSKRKPIQPWVIQSFFPEGMSLIFFSTFLVHPCSHFNARNAVFSFFEHAGQTMLVK